MFCGRERGGALEWKQGKSGPAWRDRSFFCEIGRIFMAFISHNMNFFDKIPVQSPVPVLESILRFRRVWIRGRAVFYELVFARIRSEVREARKICEV